MSQTLKTNSIRNNKALTGAYTGQKRGDKPRKGSVYENNGSGTTIIRGRETELIVKIDGGHDSVPLNDFIKDDLGIKVLSKKKLERLKSTMPTQVEVDGDKNLTLTQKSKDEWVNRFKS